MPLSISFSFGSHVAYSVPTLTLTGIAHQCQVDFEEGSHVFTSPDFELGTIHALKSTPLIGRLFFRYTYTVENGRGTVSVCDADYESADGMTLMTFPRDREDASCFERAAAAGFAADEIHRNRYWNTRSALIPGASRIFKDIARDAAGAVIAALKQDGSVSVHTRKMLPELPLELYQQLCEVYQEDQFLCTYDEFDHATFNGRFEVKDVASVFGGTQFEPVGTEFANVIGSTGDKRPGGKSWVDLWERSTGQVSPQCASLSFPAGFVCTPKGTGTRSPVGGHIILGRTATRVAYGSQVFLIPICKAHNGNDNIFMEMLSANEVVILDKYHNP